MRFPRPPPPHRPYIAAFVADGKLDSLSMGPTLSDGRYLHWDELRRREPPPGLSLEQWWACLKWARDGSRMLIRAMVNCYSQPFSFVSLPAIQRALHEFDRINVGQVLLQAMGNDDALTEYRVRQLVEEAISSSEIEGARPTTRELARQLVREKRTPTSRDERMIYNGWLAMQRMLELRAIIVHFWLGYEHPFRDGNGRIARALFYWCMLRHGYEMAEFLSISGPIDRSPKAYYLAFAYTETDGGDLTYFIQHQLGVMQKAMEELVDHLRTRAQRMAELARTVAGFDTMNHRQRALLQHAIRHPLQSYTIAGHASSHRVHYLTARSDISDLVARGYFREQRLGQGKRLRPTEAFLDAIQKK